MAELTRYEKLRDKVRMDLHLTEDDISDTVMLSIFSGGGKVDGVLEIYSRLRGQRKYTILTFTGGVYDYDLSEVTPAVFYVEDALYNDLYPAAVFASVSKPAIQYEEQYHSPSLRMIEEYKDRMCEDMAELRDADCSTYDNEGKLYLQLEQNPETNIVVIYRVLYTVTNFPPNDIELIETLYKARVCRHLIGVPQLRSRGDVSYAQVEMENQASGFENKFYDTIKAEDGHLIART